jgi:ferredoxin-NADP reductase
MNTYTIKLREKQTVADQTLAFVFDKPEGFVFQAGQYVAITLPALDFADAKGATRTMSIASAPSDEHLLFAMRITGSAFKQTLAAMPIGGEVIIRDAVGHFTLPEDDQTHPIVFLAGGIGITPVRSILREAVRTGRRNPFTLFYSNRAPKDVAFVDELASIPELTYTCVNTLTDEAKLLCLWQKEHGFICPPMLTKYLDDIHAPLYYIVGAPGFSTAMERMLKEVLGIAPEAIRMDPFTGL